MSGVISRVGFGPFLLRLPDPGPKLLGRSISLKFLLDTTLES